MYKKLSIQTSALPAFALSLMIGTCLTMMGCSSNKDYLASSSESNDANILEKEVFTVQLLGINDFHGQVLPMGKQGGMDNLSKHLLGAIDNTQEHSFILHGGDHVGASPAESALLQDEPSIDFLNILQGYCDNQRNGTCHVIGTAGNHEFDEGSDEMLRLFEGGNHENGPFIHRPWHGSNYQTLSANVLDKTTQSLLLQPYAIHHVNNVPIGFIGITLDTTPELVIPGAVDNLIFNNQAQAVSYYSLELQRRGIETIVVIVHDGTETEYYSGQTKHDLLIPTGSAFSQFLTQLPDAVDVVVSGHSHEFTNAYINNSNGKSILVTQAFANGMAYSDISISIDPISKDVVASSAEVIYTSPDAWKKLSAPALSIASNIETLIAQSSHYAQAHTLTVINTYVPIADEIPLGQFIADSHHYALDTDIGVMNDGGVRADLNPGKVTWGDLFAIQPFNNALMIRRFTGKQIALLIDSVHFWSSNITVRDHGQIFVDELPLSPTKHYTLGGNAYIMNSEGFSEGELVRVGGIDIEKTVAYVKSLPTPFNLHDTPRPKK